MQINEPKVTLADDARIGVKEEVRQGFLDWLFRAIVTGDDGELYSFGGSILSMHAEKMDLVTMHIDRGRGGTRQLRNSIYRVGEYPGELMPKRFFKHPQGTLQITQHPDHIIVTCGREFTLEAYSDNRWHLTLDSGDGEYYAELHHAPKGYPLWYGREKPSALTQHSITYGYNWAGPVEGYFVYRGKRVNIMKGFALRERYVAVDSSAAELGAWEDWGFVCFDGMHSSMYDMRAGMKDYSIYDVETGKHYTSLGNLKGGDRDISEMEIVHEDWAFYRPLDGFYPSRYRIRINTEDGVYSVSFRVANIDTWGVTYKHPDNPVATLVFDQAEGTFTYRDGRVKHLTDGYGFLSIRQWHAYPNILPAELYSDETKSGEKFDTL
ncbi:MAG: hypothetical protein IJ662_14105 [Clostridia bacterium]|nr:hypothetical protein [Clostridia bacterium]MBR1586670.1 hypothetical protein [Clostridia bacterium]